MPDGLQADAASGFRQDDLTLERLPDEILCMICEQVDYEDLPNMRLVSRQLGALAARALFRFTFKTFNLHDIYEVELLANSPYACYVHFLEFYDDVRGIYLEPFSIPRNPSEILRIVNIMRTSVRKLTQLRGMKCSNQMITAGRNEDLSRMHAEAFLDALQHVDLPHLHELELHFDKEGTIAHLLEIAKATPTWWYTFSSRLRILELFEQDEEAYLDNRFGLREADERPTPAKESCLTELTRQMVKLENLTLVFLPPQIWPVGGEAFCSLQTMDLDCMETKAEHLAALIEENSTTLQECSLFKIDLLCGWWDQVLVSFAQCKTIQLVRVRECGYSIDADDRSKGFRKTDVHEYNPLHSYRWADWHALRDLLRDVSVFDDCIAGIKNSRFKWDRDQYLQLKQFWEALSHQYRSLEDYRTHPDLHMERLHDRLGETNQRDLAGELYVPQGYIYTTKQNA